MDQSNQGGQCLKTRWDPTWSSTVASTAVTGITSPPATLLNLLVIVAVVKEKQLRSVHNILLASMAVADLIISGVAQPLTLTAGIFRLQNDYLNMCRTIVLSLSVMYIQAASIYHLTAIAWERYLAVKNPINYKTIVTRTRMTNCIIAMWVLTSLMILPSSVYLTGQVGRTSFAVASVFLSVIPLTICLAATAYFYITIFNASCKTNRNPINLTNVAQVARANREKEVAKTTFLLTVALLISFAPTVVVVLLRYLLHPFFNRDAFLWCVIFNQSNSLFSPILYFYRNRRLRTVVIQILKIRKSPAMPDSRDEAKNAVIRCASNDNSHSQKPQLGSKSCTTASTTEMNETSTASRPKTASMCSGKCATHENELLSLCRSKTATKKKECTNIAVELDEKLCPVES